MHVGNLLSVMYCITSFTDVMFLFDVMMLPFAVVMLPLMCDVSHMTVRTNCLRKSALWLNRLMDD